MSKAARIRAALAKDPEVGTPELALRFGVTAHYVRALRRQVAEHVEVRPAPGAPPQIPGPTFATEVTLPKVVLDRARAKRETVPDRIRRAVERLDAEEFPTPSAKEAES